MAVVLLEGFDHINGSTQFAAKGWSGDGGGVIAGRFGGQASRTNNSTIYHVLPGSYSTIIVGFAVLVSDLGVVFISGITQLMSGGGIAINLKYYQPGGPSYWGVYTGGGTLLGYGTTPITPNVWNYVELKVVISATVGSIELRLNGETTPEILATGLNTGTGNINGIRLQGSYGAGSSHDDIYVCDTTGSAPANTFLGECRVETLAPNGNGANTAWTGAYTDVDDGNSYDSDTTYISSNTPGDRETATLADLSVTSGTVFAVQTNLVARKDDAGFRTIAPVLRIGGVNYDGTTTASLSATYLDYTQLHDRLDPSGAAWTVSTVNAMEAGVKEVA